MSVFDLTGRKALVTGGARGLGAGMAEALARAGAAVVIGDIREALGAATVDAIKKAGGDAAFLPLDVTDDQSWARCGEGAIAELGALDVVTLGLFPSVPDAIGAVVGLTPQGRLGEVSDMADAVVFLASDASRFITGAGLPVDGGMGM